jgi:hypothetical protein
LMIGYHVVVSIILSRRMVMQLLNTSIWIVCVKSGRSVTNEPYFINTLDVKTAVTDDRYSVFLIQLNANGK